MKYGIHAIVHNTSLKTLHIIVYIMVTIQFKKVKISLQDEQPNVKLDRKLKCFHISLNFLFTNLLSRSIYTI